MMMERREVGWIFVAITIACFFGLAAGAGEMDGLVLTVDGKPFFPLGSWNDHTTTPEDIDRLGMNTSYRGGPSTDPAVEQFRGFMGRCEELGIQVIPYLSYGGAGVIPWTPEAVRSIAKLADEPNLLAWYVGDDITMKHLAGIRQTVGILREETPNVPTAADYIADETPEAQTTFTEYVDIRCQYSYPIPNESYEEYMAFFDRQRAFVGDPLWTWVQNFMWGSTGALLNVGGEGSGPLPDPEQVRLLAHAAINSGVRGLLFFPHHQLHRLPEVAAEVALTCRSIRLFDEHLAAGERTADLPVSDADLNATAFRYGESTVISLALFRPDYHHYVDEGIVENVTVDCPWPGDTLPNAFLATIPDVTECAVTRLPESGMIRVTIPRLELAGFILLTADPVEAATLYTETAKIPHALRYLMAPATAAQTRKVTSVVWQLGLDNLYAGTKSVMAAMRAGERCADATVDGRYADAYRAWRETLRADRILLDEVMQFAEQRRDVMSDTQKRYLISPYGLRNIQGLSEAPSSDDPWNFNRGWLVAGPFPLEMDAEDEDAMPAAFERAYGPEGDFDPAARFETVDGVSGWRRLDPSVSVLLNLLHHFGTADDVVAYARCVIVAPRDMEARLSLGSNDGARVWVNGALVFSKHVPRGGTPHDDEIPVKLKAGANPVLVKVENLGASWKLYLSVHDPKREISFDLP
jgi:hypothetical protein